MARKKRTQPPENHERWLISYADFITLLFAFFVVMFASSQTDKGRAQQVSDSVKKALEGEKLSSMLAAVLGGSVDNVGKGNAMMRGPGGAQKAPVEKTDPKMAELLPSLKVLSEELKSEIECGKNPDQHGAARTGGELQTGGAVSIGRRRCVGRTRIEALEKVAKASGAIPNPVRLEGHTDSIPIKTARFRSNWELSAARSIAIMELLATRFGVPRERLSVAGYANVVPDGIERYGRRSREKQARRRRDFERTGDTCGAGQSRRKRRGSRREMKLH